MIIHTRALTLRSMALCPFGRSGCRWAAPLHIAGPVFGVKSIEGLRSLFGYLGFIRQVLPYRPPIFRPCSSITPKFYFPTSIVLGNQACVSLEYSLGISY